MKLRAVRLARRALMLAVLALDALDSALAAHDPAPSPVPESLVVRCLCCGTSGREWICDSCADHVPEVRA